MVPALVKQILVMTNLLFLLARRIPKIYIYFNDSYAQAVGDYASNEPVIDDKDGVKSFTINVWIKTNVSSQTILAQEEQVDTNEGSFSLYFCCE